MSEDFKELMQVNKIEEDINLSNMIQDIVPIKENSFTNLELEANKNENFSLVIYKKENVITRLFKNIRFAFEKIKIMKESKEVAYIKQKD